MHPLRIFIGYDPREAIAYHVCCQSILEHTRAEVSFHPVRGERRDGSNDFIYARFLVPYLCGWRGRALFVDGDMLVRSDVSELFDLDMSYLGVRVVKHDYRTKHPVKYLGYRNEDYPRKNWSSVMFWNCDFYPNRVLTPEFVKTSTGAELHRFTWIKDEQIGELDPKWNKLVLEETLEEGDKLRHFTIGIPAFSEYIACDGAEEWHGALARAMRPVSL